MRLGAAIILPNPTTTLPLSWGEMSHSDRGGLYSSPKLGEVPVRAERSVSR